MRFHVTHLLPVLLNLSQLVALLRLSTPAEAFSATASVTPRHTASVISPLGPPKTSLAWVTEHAETADGFSLPKHACRNNDVLIDSFHRRPTAILPRDRGVTVIPQLPNQRRNTPTRPTGAIGFESKEEHRRKIQAVKDKANERIREEKKRAKEMENKIEDLEKKEKERRKRALEKELEIARNATVEIEIRKELLRGFKAALKKANKVAKKSPQERAKLLREIREGKFM
ncbi:hypothetical protein BKA81DRAFT_382378 [Phyllosticta paracitricarpa]|uniref:Uncharacterized protein n=1 Tax=Phyllosticta paracitricarpa TaxID=2016321 RepID=A0ABR1MU84_9PEZI